MLTIMQAVKRMLESEQLETSEYISIRTLQHHFQSMPSDSVRSLLLKMGALIKPHLLALIIYHNDWTNSVLDTETALKNRGYIVSLTDSGQEGLKILQNASENLLAGDRMVVYLAGHGSNPRKWGDTTKATALEHYVLFNNDTIVKISQVAPLFELLCNEGVQLNVIDGSCNGGETVYNSIGQKYCAVATAGVYSPGVTDFPSPSHAISKDGNPSTFGLWWDDPYLTASWMNGETITACPQRIHQRIYRNDKGEFSSLSLFFRPALGCLSAWDNNGWELHWQYCYLYRFIYPDEFNALSQEEQNKFTNDLGSFVAYIHGVVDPQYKFIARLKEYLDNKDLIAKAAEVYETNIVGVWRTLTNDPSWDPSADPWRYWHMNNIFPYSGKSGFLTIVSELKNQIASLQTMFSTQQELLQKIDDIVLNGPVVEGLPKLTTMSRSIVEFADPTRYNEFEKGVVNKLKAIDSQKNIDLSGFMQFIRNWTPTQNNPSSPLSKDVHGLSMEDKNIAKSLIAKSASQYRDYFRTEIADEISILQSEKGFSISSPLKEKDFQLSECWKDLADLASDFKSYTPLIYFVQGRSSFMLAIIEDAIAKVESGSGNPGDVIFY
jgi:hypothetical protein